LLWGERLQLLLVWGGPTGTWGGLFEWVVSLQADPMWLRVPPCLPPALFGPGSHPQGLCTGAEEAVWGQPGFSVFNLELFLPRQMFLQGSLQAGFPIAVANSAGIGLGDP
jgi:hypothetical protein